MILSRTLSDFLREEMVPLRDRFSEEHSLKGPCEQNRTDSAIWWFKNELGFETLPLESFLRKWEVPDGQYKNWSVVLQTLQIVPRERRVKSTGIIVGAKMAAGGGTWIPHLLDSMLAMGYTGTVSLYDVGLEPETWTGGDLVIHCFASYYKGSDRFTWSVDDTWLYGAPGRPSYISEYASYKSQDGNVEAVGPWFHRTEKRLFQAHGKSLPIVFPWQKGQCPCDRCCFEHQFPEEVQRRVRFFNPYCKPGAWAVARDVVRSLTTANSYVPSTATAEGTALLIANDSGWASGDNCLMPFKGPLEYEDKLKGDQPVVAKTLTEKNGPVIPLPVWDIINERVSLPFVRDLAARTTFLPEGHYPEFEPTGILFEGRRGYRRLQLPVEVDEAGAQKRCRDPYGRIYVGHPCLNDEVWCWSEKLKVKKPHICPLGRGPRKKIWRGYATDYKHPEDAKDLCTICDRSVMSYFHKCPGGLMFVGIDREKAIQALDANKWDRDSIWAHVPPWTDEEELFTGKQKRNKIIRKKEDE